jgi:hypothetical protein
MPTAQRCGELCKHDRCHMFSQLNPYRSYTNGWDELIRQSCAMGDIEAWAMSSGTVMITRPAFRVAMAGSRRRIPAIQA